MEKQLKTVVWGNYKGGVGKTTSVFQVAAYFAQNGKKVLLLDLDPQCSLSRICSEATGGEQKALSEYQVDEVFNYLIEIYMRYINYHPDIDLSLLMGADISIPGIDVILNKICVALPKYNNNLKFIPSSINFEDSRLNDLAQKMGNNIYNIFLMHLVIKEIAKTGKFDYLFIDCPPTSNMLIQSAFLASNYYIVPTIVDEISAKGVVDYILQIENTYKRFALNEQIGSLLLYKVFATRTKLVGVFETIYKERRGDADNSWQVFTLDRNIQEEIPDIETLISNPIYIDYRYNKPLDAIDTKNIFRYYIGHRDNRSTGESIPENTSGGKANPFYREISQAILKILEDQ